MARQKDKQSQSPNYFLLAATLPILNIQASSHITVALCHAVAKKEDPSSRGGNMRYRNSRCVKCNAGQYLMYFPLLYRPTEIRRLCARRRERLCVPHLFSLWKKQCVDKVYPSTVQKDQQLLCIDEVVR